MTEQVRPDGFLETALERAFLDAPEAPSLGGGITITYTEEFESGRTYAISPEIHAVLGYTQEQWMGDADLWIRRVHPDDRDRVVSDCDRSNETLTPYRCVYRFVALDGRTVWVRDEADLVMGADGAPLCWQGVMRVIEPPQ